jgi:hypothetical protein
MSSETSLEISRELFRKIQSRLDEFGFDSVDECVEFVMTEFISETKEKNFHPELSEDEEKQIKKRLRSLGYLGQ